MYTRRSTRYTRVLLYTQRRLSQPHISVSRLYPGEVSGSRKGNLNTQCKCEEAVRSRGASVIRAQLASQLAGLFLMTSSNNTVFPFPWPCNSSQNRLRSIVHGFCAVYKWVIKTSLRGMKFWKSFVELTKILTLYIVRVAVLFFFALSPLTYKMGAKLTMSSQHLLRLQSIWF